jgi:hypothetical protein
MIFTRRFGALRARRTFPVAPEVEAEQERLLEGIVEDRHPQQNARTGTGDESAA